MKILPILALFCLVAVAANAVDTQPLYELRVYHTNPGKMPDLLKRFREHTITIFNRHGMESVGYWLPVAEKDRDKLYYILRHASREAAKASWQAFGADPEWREVAAASEAQGRIVAKVDSTFLVPTGFTPAALPALTGGHVFELRTYTTNDGKLGALDARFRDHTMALFRKHGITNVLYTHPADADQGAAVLLVYLIAHDSVEGAKANWDAFRADPDWVQAKAESEAAGPILAHAPDSVFLTPTDFSALK